MSKVSCYNYKIILALYSNNLILVACYCKRPLSLSDNLYHQLELILLVSYNLLDNLDNFRFNSTI